MHLKCTRVSHVNGCVACSRQPQDRMWFRTASNGAESISTKNDPEKKEALQCQRQPRTHPAHRRHRKNSRVGSTQHRQRRQLLRVQRPKCGMCHVADGSVFLLRCSERNIPVSASCFGYSRVVRTYSSDLNVETCATC